MGIQRVTKNQATLLFMKTPKRQTEEWERFVLKDRLRMNEERIKHARWKSKNKLAQYKRTIARLTLELTAERRQLNELWLGDHLKRFSPEWDAFIQLRGLKTPSADATLDEKFEYWVALRDVGKSVLNAACLAAMAYGEAKGNAENGQQNARKGEA